jgi:Preprotein translocase subunit SecD
MFNSVLTLPGIAGLILSLGIAVDANVLIYERLRDEIKQGKSLRVAIDTSYRKRSAPFSTRTSPSFLQRDSFLAGEWTG